jgi:hypothetical protein
VLVISQVCICASALATKKSTREPQNRPWQLPLSFALSMLNARFYLSKSSTNACTNRVCLERGQKEFLVLAVTFDMLIPKITLFSQYMCALAHLRAGIIFQQRPSLSCKCSNECVCMYKSNGEKNACLHFGRRSSSSSRAQYYSAEPTNLHTPSS